MITLADHQVYDYRVPFVLFCMLFKNLCAWIYFIDSVFDSPSYSICQSQLSDNLYELGDKYQ